METRELRGGPLDGLVRAWPEWLALDIAVDCPWGIGDVFHLATAHYDRDGRWTGTACYHTDGGPLRTGPGGGA